MLGLRNVWFTNISCVSRILSTIARNLGDVYPSPNNLSPSSTHLHIARWVASSPIARQAMFVHPDAQFDEKTFVMRGSGKGSIFEKQEHDKRYHHHEGVVNDFYLDRMDFEEGDEVLQVGTVGIRLFLAHQLGWKAKL